MQITAIIVSDDEMIQNSSPYIYIYIHSSHGRTYTLFFHPKTVSFEKEDGSLSGLITVSSSYV